MEHLWQILITVLYCITTIHAEWSLTCQVNNNTTPCPPMACDGDLVTFILTADHINESYAAWMLPNGTCQRSTTPDIILLVTTQDHCRHGSGLCGPFHATNIDPGRGIQCLQSNLTVIMNSTRLLIQYGIVDLNFNKDLKGSTEINARAGTECHAQVLQSPSVPLLLSPMSTHKTQQKDATLYNSSGSTTQLYNNETTTPTPTPSNNPFHIGPCEDLCMKIVVIIIFIIIGGIIIIIYYYRRGTSLVTYLNIICRGKTYLYVCIHYSLLLHM